MSLKLDPATGDYQVENGRIVNDDSLLTPAYIRLKTPRKGWMYAPDESFGSDLNKAHIRVKDVVAVEESAQKALDPLVRDGRARDVTVQAVQVARGAVELQAVIVDDRGKQETYIFNSIGD